MYTGIGIQAMSDTASASRAALAQAHNGPSKHDQNNPRRVQYSTAAVKLDSVAMEPPLRYYPRNNAYARFDFVQLTSGSGTQDDKEAKRDPTVLSLHLGPSLLSVDR